MLTPGAKLGPYEIVDSIGAGGMGEVYKARDTRLDRIVAIKVLPAHFAEDPELRQRFDREAKALSSLSHPHICTLHDVGSENGVDFLVMEYLEGESLAQRLAKGPLPTDQLLRTAIQIADALDKAHRQGVVHRDLKPGNIVLTKAGAKLLDFGLAKPTANVLGSAITDLSKSPTQSIKSPTKGDALTAAGTIVGTFQYMAPEQLEGRDADARSDIFALGCVLYEMATARPAFAGKTKASLIAAILASEPPPISSLQPLTSPVLDRLVRICLSKDPDERFQSVHDLKLQVEMLAEGGTQIGVPVPVAARRKSRELTAWAAAGVFGLAALALAAALLLRPAPAALITRASIVPPPGTNFMLEGRHPGPPVISPDGRLLVFAARGKDSQVRLWVRPLDAVVATPLSGTEDAGYPFWSPDSKTIGFFAQGKLKKIEAAGGPPLTLCDAPVGKGGAWSRDGVIVFAPSFGSGLRRVAAAGGEATPITTMSPEKGENSHRHPQFLPDGRHFLYVVRAGPTGSDRGSSVMVGSLDGEPKVLMPSQNHAAYASGYLLFVRESTLMARPFDPDALEFTGEAVPLAEQIATIGGTARSLFTTSDTGALVYLTGATAQGSVLEWVDAKGQKLGQLGEMAPHDAPRISPDGRYVAVAISDLGIGTEDIWVYEVARNLRTRFTFDPAVDIAAAWSPDGSRVVYASNRKGRFDIYQKSVTGAGVEELLFQSDVDKFPQHWSRDGRFLAYATFTAGAGGDVWVLPLQGDRKPVAFLDSRFDESNPRFSPDGRWIAYDSGETGRSEVYISPFPGPGRKWQVSASGGFAPHWRDDGKEVYFTNMEGKILAVEVGASAGGLTLSAPRELFESTELEDVSRDARRFLLNRIPGAQTSEPLTLVLHWPSHLKKK